VNRLNRVVQLSIALVLLGLLWAPSAASASPGDVGIRDQTFKGTSEATGSRPESKLWWNDGYWWASMLATDSHHYIFKLVDPAAGGWVNTGVKLDSRAASRADTLWDGTHLYVSSHRFGTTPVEGYPSWLYRLSYDSSTGTYTRDAGFPVEINNWQTETLVIEKDSTGTLWATWVQGPSGAHEVYVNRTLTPGDDSTWGTPFALGSVGVSGTAVSNDDISSVIAFGHDSIGVMWSNQKSTPRAMDFAVHLDSAPASKWQTTEAASSGPAMADDHINLKADDQGRVYAAVKTSKTKAPDPLIQLLVRSATGTWSAYTFGTVSDDHTRPVVVLDEQLGVIHMFATGPPHPTGKSCGSIYEKTTSMSSISFPSGLGTLVMDDGTTSVDCLNNVTASKQNVNTTTGLVVEASEGTTHYYWHAYEPS
jgi:hypothetical protein